MLNPDYVLVKKVEEPVSDGFQAVAVEDSSIYKGEIVQVPEGRIFIGEHGLIIGDVIIFAKYSPDTHLIVRDEVELKYINKTDILEVL